MSGDPDLGTTAKAIQILDKIGADVIELGVPYSVRLLHSASACMMGHFGLASYPESPVNIKLAVRPLFLQHVTLQLAYNSTL